MTDRYAQTRSLLALDIERWSRRNAVDQRYLQADLTTLVDAALQTAGLDSAVARRQHTGDGLLLSFPADVDKARLTQPFVHALDEGVRRHLFDAPADRRMRLRVGLHHGDIVDDNADWQGAAVVEICRLLDSDVLRRVLSEARTSVLALVLSRDWYAAVVAEGWVSDQGYRHVRVPSKDGDREAWVRVPGLSEPPGLARSDAWRHEGVDGAQERPAEQPVSPLFDFHFGDQVSDSSVHIGDVGGNVGDITTGRAANQSIAGTD